MTTMGSTTEKFSPGECCTTDPVTGKATYSVLTQCSRCALTTRTPIGHCNPAEVECGHVFRLDSGSDCVVCTGCRLRISGQALWCVGIRPGMGESARLADECQRLKDQLGKADQVRGTLERELDCLRKQVRK